eukprot:TRINITY_DN18893_c0_g1_i1.p1 TRINITY_DN18893_c0_g1~~TRINITY_DN18893_c0_g1_i1.p1  ORF type:complete len:587 (-),score=101.93 TRINITY_DN18893_c0_g1_i1:8-1768(-)
MHEERTYSLDEQTLAYPSGPHKTTAVCAYVDADEAQRARFNKNQLAALQQCPIRTRYNPKVETQQRLSQADAALFDLGAFKATGVRAAAVAADAGRRGGKEIKSLKDAVGALVTTVTHNLSSQGADRAQAELMKTQWYIDHNEARTVLESCDPESKFYAVRKQARKQASLNGLKEACGVERGPSPYDSMVQRGMYFTGSMADVMKARALTFHSEGTQGSQQDQLLDAEHFLHEEEEEDLDMPQTKSSIDVETLEKIMRSSSGRIRRRMSDDNDVVFSCGDKTVRMPRLLRSDSAGQMLSLRSERFARSHDRGDAVRIVTHAPTRRCVEDAPTKFEDVCDLGVLGQTEKMMAPSLETWAISNHGHMNPARRPPSKKEWSVSRNAATSQRKSIVVSNETAEVDSVSESMSSEDDEAMTSHEKFLPTGQSRTRRPNAFSRLARGSPVNMQEGESDRLAMENLPWDQRRPPDPCDFEELLQRVGFEMPALDPDGFALTADYDSEPGCGILFETAMAEQQANFSAWSLVDDDGDEDFEAEEDEEHEVDVGEKIDVEAAEMNGQWKDLAQPAVVQSHVRKVFGPCCYCCSRS